MDHGRSLLFGCNLRLNFPIVKCSVSRQERTKNVFVSKKKRLYDRDDVITIIVENQRAATRRMMDRVSQRERRRLVSVY